MARPTRMYVPLDVAFPDDEKVIAAGERAAWLYVNILLRTKQLDTDGVITRTQIARTGVQGWQQRLSRLVEVGLLSQVNGESYLIPRWSKWNELSHERDERHRKDRERKSGIRAESRRNPDGIQTDSMRISKARQNKAGNPPQPPPVADVLRRLQGTPDGAA